jgi:hypothetical protein
MCRNIKTLYNFDPPASDEEVSAAAPPKDREAEAAKRRARAEERFAV